MAELHIIGQIVGGYGFPSANIFCKWDTAIGNTWNILEGKEKGQTQVDHPKVLHNKHMKAYMSFIQTDFLPFCRMECLLNGAIQ